MIDLGLSFPSIGGERCKKRQNDAAQVVGRYIWRMKRLLLLGLLWVFSATGFAQPHPYGNWLIYFGNAKISEKWSIWHEVQVRQYELVGEMEQLMLRTAINYHTTGNTWLSQGYARVGSWRYRPGSNIRDAAWEHRLYQQILLRQQLKNVFITHRYRLEERFLPDQFQLRFRYFLSVNVPLNKPKMEKGAVYAATYNEVFLRRPGPTFDRNRLYGGLGYVVDAGTRFEVAWMEQQYENRRRGQLQFVMFQTF